jgi:hypothetical protein
MDRAVITDDASSAIETVYADRGGLNRHKSSTDSSGREVLVESLV